MQPGAPTVQETLQGVLLRLSGEDIKVHGSGRTDAGVHARGQVAHGWAEGAHDAWASFSGMTQEGYRDHSAGRAYRLNGNTGWQWADNAETRIFIAYNNIWQQIPGAVTRSQALSNPRAAATANLVGNYMRNVEATRIGTVTAMAFALVAEE
jgi:iron complex outermembrane receptor protein